MIEYHERLAKIGGSILTIIGLIQLILAIFLRDKLNRDLSIGILVIAFTLLLIGIPWLLIFFFKIRKPAQRRLTLEKIEQKRNFAVYRAMIEQLVQEHPYKWGLISNGALKCIKDSHEQILEEIKLRKLNGKLYYVFQIGKIIKNNRLVS
ncbi:MAG: hypothetical protein ACTSQI_21955 [Candidatus Helarchaeota archaeon]